MGYTHYWGRGTWDGKNENCSKAFDDCVNFVKAQANLYNLQIEEQTPDLYYIDGPEDETCETFVLDRYYDNEFQFCKTRQYPYDDIVTGCLAVLAEHGLDVSSDGDPEEWDTGVVIVTNFLDREIYNPIGE